MTWNKKNDQYALSCGITRMSTRLLLGWILRRAKLNQVDEIEIDLRLFNTWVAKYRGRPFDRKTLREAIAQLDEKTQGLVLITKSYTPWVKKILVRPLETVLQENSPTKEQSPKLSTGNPMFSNDHKKTSRELLLQNISRLDTLFQKLGMHYSQDSLINIWNLAGRNLANLGKAVNYMLQVHSTKINRAKERGLNNPEELQAKGITEPRGWLHDCLIGDWHLKNQTASLPLLQPNEHYLFDRPT